MIARHFLAISAAAILSAVAISAQAQTIPFAQFGATSSLPNLVWLSDGTSGTLFAVGGTSGGADVEFEYVYPSLVSVGFLPAELTLNATSTSAATDSGVLDQSGLAGSFQFTYTGAGFTANGRSYGDGTDLLSGTFTDGSIVGYGSAGSVLDSIVAGGTVTFDSSVLNFANAGDKAFSLSFTSPTGMSLSGSQLGTFVANSTGTYSAEASSITVQAVPEPATWAMLIFGFFGLGAVLRSQRKAVAAPVLAA